MKAECVYFCWLPVYCDDYYFNVTVDVSSSLTIIVSIITAPVIAVNKQKPASIIIIITTTAETRHISRRLLTAHIRKYILASGLQRDSLTAPHKKHKRAEEVTDCESVCVAAEFH